MNEVVETSPAKRLHAQAVITERLQGLSLIASFTMTAADVKRTLDWLASDDFAETCRDAGADPATVTGKFHQLIEKGNRNNVRGIIS